MIIIKKYIKNLSDKEKTTMFEMYKNSYTLEEGNLCGLKLLKNYLKNIHALLHLKTNI